MAEYMCRKHHPRLRMIIRVVMTFTFLTGLNGIITLPEFSDLVEAKEGPVVSEIEADWSEAVEEDIQASEYQVTWQEQTYLPDAPVAYQAPNRAQNLRSYFTPHGITLIPRQWDPGQTAPPWRWDLELITWGYEGALQPVPAAELIARSNHIDYQRGELVEWYRNGESGVEQGFTLLTQPSAGKEKDRMGEQATIALQLALSGDLIPVLVEDGAAVDFMTAGGVHVLRYGDLLARDATGRSLNAQFQLIPSAVNPCIDILIEAGQAIYPITVDPMLTTPSWSVENNYTFGYSVAWVNVNGDAYSDVIVGWPKYDGGSDQMEEGRVHVYYGSATGFSPWENWSAEGNQAGAWFGYSVGNAGDVNGDGYDDVIIGAPFYNNGELAEGRVFVYYGSSGGLSSTPTWTADGNLQDAHFGYSVGGAGDVNKDGFDDVIIGAPGDYELNVVGKAHVWYGSDSGLGDPTDADWSMENSALVSGLGVLVGTAGDINQDNYSDVLIGAYAARVFVWEGGPSGLGDPSVAVWEANLGDYISEGYSSSTAGDLNGDGADEVIVSALYAKKAFVWYGSASGLGDDGTPANADWTFQTPTHPYHLDRLSVNSAGDVDHDGYGDVIIGASYTRDTLEDWDGMAFIFRGSSGGLVQTTEPDWQIHGGEYYHALRVSAAGDVNGDGFGDVVIGAPDSIRRRSDPPGAYSKGMAFVYYGASYTPNTSPAWITESDLAGAALGFSVSTAGDVNGDGYTDVVVGAPLYDNGQTDEGRARVYHGSASGLSASAVWTAESDQQDARFGFSVGSAGDVNGDSYSDVIIGAPYYNGSKTGGGKVLVYYGSASGLVGGGAPWSVEGNQDDAHLGYAVSGAGDVNGDGYADVVIGAPDFDNGEQNEGRAFVYRGSVSGVVGVDPWSTESDQANAHLGFSVGSAGDVNGDGYADVVIGAPDYDNGQSNEGRAIVWNGSMYGLGDSGIPDNADWSAESDQVGARFGFSVSTAADTDGNGCSDVLVGAPYYDYVYGYGDEGQAYLFNGSTLGLALTSSWTEIGMQKDAHLGYSLGTAGDVNGDVYADLLIGEPGYTSTQWKEGRALLYQGSATGPGDIADWIMEGGQDNAGFGSSVGLAGDVNGDGYADVIVGAPGFGNKGGAFLFIGSNQGLQSNAAWWYDGTFGSSYGIGSLSSAGDVNGDGFEDVILGWPNDPYLKGKAVVFHGSASGLNTLHDPDWVVYGSQDYAFFGASVSGAGDVNGDGYDDVIIGAPHYYTEKNGGGRAFVYYGSPSGLLSTPAWWVESNNFYANLGASVDTAGDVNGDGYSDVIVGVPHYNYDWRKGAAFVYHGSVSGLSPTSNWEYISGNFEDNFGSSVSTAGDVNGDGYSDVIVGRGIYEGWAYVFHGSSSGLAAAPNRMYHGDQGGAALGWSVNQAGDVNSDGYDDVIIGAPGYDDTIKSLSNTGRAYVFHGSYGGLPLEPNWSAYGGNGGAFFGSAVNTAGDVNGDGYSDIVVGDPYIDVFYFFPFYGEGQAQVYRGTASGLSTSPNWNSSSGQQDAYGFVVGVAGDVNSDGYSDLLVGSPRHNVVGRAFLYYGTSGGGIQSVPQQRLADGSARVLRDGQSGSPSQVLLAVLARTPFGRSRVRIQWEIELKDVPFDGAGIEQSTWMDSGVAGHTFNELINGLAFEKYYHWRVRILGRPANAASNSAITYRSPWLPGLTFVTALSGVQTINSTGHTNLLGQSSYVEVDNLGSLTSLTLTGYPDTAHPQEFSTPGMDRLLNRYYTITPNGGASGYQVDLCLAYDQNEVAVLEEGYLRLCGWDSEGWHCYARGSGSDDSNNLVCANNVIAFSDWMFDPLDPTAVTLGDFYAVSTRDGILISWNTAQELGNLGFNLYRRNTPNGEFLRLNANLITSQANGSPVGASYTYLDTRVLPGDTYGYKLENIGTLGGGRFFGPINITFLNSQIYLPFLIRR